MPLALTLLLAVNSLKAQTYNDGAMQIKINVSRSYVESVDDPITGELNADEFRWRFWMADNANLDGQGFIGGNVVGINSNNAGWLDNGDFTLFNYTYGTPGSTPVAVPQYMQLQAEGWEDDCYDCYRSTGTFSWACDQCSDVVYDGGCGCSTNILCGCSSEDQHCGPTVVNGSINYRAVAPCLSLVQPPAVGSAWIGDYSSNVCGSDDIGAQLLSYWTPPIPDPIVTTANVLCQPGLVTLSTGGAVYGGDYHWYNNGTNILVGTGSQITPSVATTTTFRVHTFNGSCESLSYRLITITVGSPSITSVNSTNPTCSGSTNGTITVNATGGTAPLQYSNNGGATWQLGNTFSNLAAGFYNIWVKDANGCTVIYSGNSVVLTQPQPISIFVNKVDAACNGSSTGRIDIFAGGGSGNFQFSIDNGSTYQPSAIFSNLPAGNYNIVVKDANNCSYPFLGNPVTISQPTPVSATTTVVDASCAGNGNGSITVNATGGTSPYNYSLNNGPFFPNQTFTALPAGTYTIIVADANGCQGLTTATINSSYIMSASVQSQTDVSCSGGADGTVTLSQTGGVAPFQYSINGGATFQNSATFNALSGGAYTGTVRDANGCLASVAFTIVERPVLTVSVVSITNVGCFGDSTGAVNVVATGGDNTYNFNWSNSTTAQNLTNVPAGNYTVTVTDGAGCTAATSANVTSNPALILQLEKLQNVLCHAGHTGLVDITIYGGTPGYTYNWSNGFAGEDLVGVEARNYQVTVTDAANCSITAAYSVTQPGSQLNVTVAADSVNCPGGNDGSLTATGVGGTAPYNFVWSNGQAGATITGLTEGLYVVSVTDSNSCANVAAVNLYGPAPFSFTDNVIDAKCNGSTDGGVNVTVSGGTPNYTYLWTNGSAGANLTGVAAGVHVITVTDAANCTVSKTYNVGQPSPILSSVAGSDPDCNGNATGFAVVSAGGGTLPFTYLWNTTPAQTGVIGVKLSGDELYYVTITDANACTHIDSVLLNNPSPITVSTVPTDVKCFSGSNGQVVINASGGAGGYEYYLNGIYQSSNTYTGLTAGDYTAVAQDINNCVGSVNFTIYQPQAFVVNAGPDLVSLRGQTVQLNGNATSTKGIIGYEWGPNINLSCTACQSTNASPDSTTTYVLTATDGDSCRGYDSVTVFVKTAFQAFIPTAFTPNGDNLNDYFEFDVLGAETVQVDIFNRWGERIYNNVSQPNGNTNGNAWNGTKDGKKMPYDTYVYQLKVKYYDGSDEVLTGTVALVR